MAKIIYSDISDVSFHYVFGELSIIEVPKQVRGNHEAINKINEYLAINEALKYCRYCFNSGDDDLIAYGVELIKEATEGKYLQAIFVTAIPTKAKEVESEINRYLLTTLNK